MPTPVFEIISCMSHEHFKISDSSSIPHLNCTSEQASIISYQYVSGEPKDDESSKPLKLGS